LSNQRVDFVMDGSISAKLRVAAHPDDLSGAFTILTGLVIGPVVRKDNDEVRRAVLEGLETLERDGKLKELLAKYQLAEFAQPVELRR
jgi:ABC-type amino acid transport substrate-binding protein